MSNNSELYQRQLAHSSSGTKEDILKNVWLTWGRSTGVRSVSYFLDDSENK